MCIIGAHFITMVWTRYLLTRIPIILSIVVFSVASFFSSVKWIEGPFFAGLGVLDQGQLYAHISQKQLDIDIDHYYSASAWVNENSPQDAKILTWHLYGYHLEREYVRVNPMYQGVLDFGRINDASTFLKSIKELGITHLMYQSNGVLMPRRSKEFLDKCVSELLEGGKITQLKQIGPFVICSVAEGITSN